MFLCIASFDDQTVLPCLIFISVPRNYPISVSDIFFFPVRTSHNALRYGVGADESLSSKFSLQEILAMSVTLLGDHEVPRET